MSEQIMTAGQIEYASMIETHKTMNAVDVPEKYRDLPTKSAMIRAMNKDGFTTGQIAKLLKIRYQHARNVIKNPGKKEQAAA